MYIKGSKRKCGLALPRINFDLCWSVLFAVSCIGMIVEVILCYTGIDNLMIPIGIISVIGVACIILECLELLTKHRSKGKDM